MTSFLHQLKVLLWKNWLSVYRQPIWSVVLIIWPVVIFFILAITRVKYPPTQTNDCYLAPRNLQSTGMVPFLQNFLCDSDTRCANRSYVPNTGTTFRSLRKRSVNYDGGGSSYLMRSSDNQSSTSSDSTAGGGEGSISVVMTALEKLSSGNVKGAFCAITTLLPTAQQPTYRAFCNSSESMTSLVLGALFSQGNGSVFLTKIETFATMIENVQNDTDFWNMLFNVPEWINNPSLIYNGRFSVLYPNINVTVIQTCMKYIVKTAYQVQNQTSTSGQLGILMTALNQSMRSDLKSCISLFQQIPCGSGQCWLPIQQALEKIFWLISPLTNGASSNLCTSNGLNTTCNGTTNLDEFLKSVSEVVNGISSNGSDVMLRYVQGAWAIVKENNIDELILQQLEQNVSSPQLRTVFAQLLHLIYNTTDNLVTEANTSQALLNLLDQMNVLVGSELQNMQSLNGTGIVNNLTLSIVKEVQYVMNLNGLLPKANMSSLSLVELQAIINSLSTVSFESSALNGTLLQILTVINQPAFKELQQTLQALLNLNPIASNISKAFIQAFSLAIELMNTPSLTNTSVLVDMYVKEMLHLFSTDVTLVNNLAFLNSYLNYTQLLLSEAFKSYAGNVLSFLTPSNLQEISANPNNVSLELLKLISGFIPTKEKVIFEKVENVFPTLLNLVSTCQTRFSNCTSYIIAFHQELSDIMQYINDLNSAKTMASNFTLKCANFSSAEIAIVNTLFQMISCSNENVSCATTPDFYNTLIEQVSSLINMQLASDLNLATTSSIMDQIQRNITSILQVVESVDVKNLTSYLDKIIRLSKCYTETPMNSVQCTIELSVSLMDFLQTLPFPQPVHDTLHVASSIVEKWLRAINGTTDVFQQLDYLYNLSMIGFRNPSTLMEMHTNLSYVMQQLEKITGNAKLTAATEKLIQDLLEALKFSNISYTIPTSLLLETSQGLEMIKTQLQTIEWYIALVKNATDAFQATGNIDGLVTMAQVIVSNVLSSMENNPSLSPIAHEMQNVMVWLDKSHIIPALQSLLQEALSGQSLETLVNHTVSVIEMIIQQEFINGTMWTPLLSDITENDIAFVFQLLQLYHNEQLDNLSSVLLFTENVLATMESVTNSLHLQTTFNNNLQTVYNISHKVISILSNAEHNSSVDKEVLFNIYSLLLDGWNGSIFNEFPMLKKKLLDLLYFSMQCLSGSTNSSSSQNCSVTDIVNVTKLILHEFNNQTSTGFSNKEGNITMNSILECALNSLWPVNHSIAYPESAIAEELACLTKMLNVTLQLVSRINNRLSLNATWIPEMDRALVDITEKFASFNITCPALDEKMVNIIYQLSENLPEFLLSLLLNQTSYSPISSQYVKYMDEMFNIIKLYAVTHGQIRLNNTLVSIWNDTLLQLLRSNTNSNEWMLASEIIDLLSNVSTFIEESKDFSAIISRVANLTIASFHLSTNLSHLSLANIFENYFSTIIPNLIKLMTLEQNITSTKSCENTLQNYLTFFQTNMNLSLSEPFYSNVSSWACRILFSNVSASDWLEELKAIANLIMSLEPGAQKNPATKIISSFIEFLTNTSANTFENFVTSIIQLFPGKDIQTNTIVLQTLHDFITSLQSIITQIMASENSNSASTEKVAIQVIEAANTFLKSLNITGYDEIFAFASDILQVYFDFRNSTLPLESKAQKILLQILTSFQKSGLQNAFIQSVQSNILSLSSKEQQIAQTFLNAFVSAINNTISDIASQPLSYNNNLVFNIIENIIKDFNRTYAMESLGGNKDLTELIFSLGSEILKMASDQNWVDFPNISNHSSQIIEDFIQLLTKIEPEAMSQIANLIHLSDVWQQINSSLEYTPIWEVINKLMAGKLNMTQIDEIMKIVQTTITTHNITEGAEVLQLYNYFLQILNQSYSAGDINLQSALESFLTMDCQNVSKAITTIYQMIMINTNQTSLWVDETFFSNFTLNICALLHWNNSQEDWLTLLQTSKVLIAYVIPYVPDSMRKYLNATEYILMVAAEVFAQPTQDNIMNILNVVPVINELFNNSPMDWVQNSMFRKLLSFLLDLAWNSSSPKDVLILKVQNFVLTMVQDIQDMLKTQPVSPYNAWVSFAMEAIKTIMNGTQNISSEARLLEIWNLFKQSGLETVIIATVNDFLKNSSSSENAKLLDQLLQLVFNVTDSVISEIPLSLSNANKTIQVLQTALSSIIETFLPQYNNFTQELAGLQTGMEITTILTELQLLLNNISTMQFSSNSTGIEANLYNVISQILFSSNDTQYIKLLLDAQKIVNEFTKLNSTITIQQLSAIFANYLPIYMGSNNETQASLYTILNMWQYLNNIMDAQPSDVTKTIDQMLPIFQSLLNESTNVRDLMSWLVSAFSDRIPISEQNGLNKIANATQHLIDVVQTCSVNRQTCPDLIEAIQNFVSDISQLETFIQNRSLANSSFLHFGLYNQSQITFINEIFLLLSYAMGHPYNSSSDGIYEEILTLKDLIFNTTIKGNLNFTTTMYPQSIVEVLNSVNITKLLLQVENVLQTSTCANQTDKDKLFCKINVALQLTQLLNQLPLEPTIHGNLSVISSILGQWIINFNASISIYQQLIDLYNVASLTLEHQPILQAVNASLENIVHMLYDMGILKDSDMNEIDIVTHILSGIIQQLGQKTYNLSSVLQYNISEILVFMQMKLNIVNWLMLHVENKTGIVGNSSGDNAMYTVVQWIGNNYQEIEIIIRDVEAVVSSFSSISPNKSIDALKILVEDLLKAFLPKTENEQLKETLEIVLNVTRILVDLTGPDMINPINMFVNKFSTFRSDISNDPTKLLSLLWSMNQTGLISKIEKFTEFFVSNDTQFIQPFLDALKMFYNFTQMNNTINGQDLSAILVKYLQFYSGTANDVQHSLNAIINLWQYLNNLTNGQSIDSSITIIWNQLDGNIQKDVQIAWLLVQEIKNVNFSSILTSISQLQQTIQAIKGLNSESTFYNIISKKVLTIITEGMAILNNIQAKGTIAKEDIYQIYNFTHLLVQDELTWVPFQNISAMEAELLDVFYLAMAPFLGGNSSLAYSGNCTAGDVLQILIQTIFKNTTFNVSLEATTCNWQLMYNSSDATVSSNHTLDAMIYLALQSSPVFHTVCSKDNLQPLAEEMACLMQMMRLSMSILAELNNMSRFQTSLIQSLNDSLTFVCINMPHHNSTFQTDIQTMKNLESMFFNQSSPVHLLIQFIIQHYNSAIQTSNIEQVWTQMSKIIKTSVLTNGSVESRINELIETAVNLTKQTNWLEFWQNLHTSLSMNWTISDIDSSLSVLETVKRIVLLIDGVVDEKALQIYQAVASLVKDPSFFVLLNVTNSHLLNTTVLSVTECTGVVEAVSNLTSSVWPMFNLTQLNLQDILSNFGLLACNTLYAQSWSSDLEIINSILSNIVKYVPTEMTLYITATKRIISFLSEMYQSPNISQEKLLNSIYELLMQELRIFSNTTVIADNLEKIPVQNLTSVLLSSGNNATTDQVQALQTDVLHLMSRSLNATSYSQGFSALSDSLTNVASSLSSFSGSSIIAQQITNVFPKFSVALQISLIEPYATIMNCVKNTANNLTDQQAGHLDVAIQDLFTQNYELANGSMVSQILNQKLIQRYWLQECPKCSLAADSLATFIGMQRMLLNQV
ncbi:uncharacterized protein [Dendropsophus ebraccatus]|uniref:uncharacterized protein n=1 Tax=Dendropsophus ebraccatus TaxID=150705 RepID=UPI003831BEA4